MLREYAMYERNFSNSREINNNNNNNSRIRILLWEIMIH